MPFEGANMCGSAGLAWLAGFHECEDEGREGRQCIGKS